MLQVIPYFKCETECSSSFMLLHSASDEFPAFPKLGMAGSIYLFLPLPLPLLLPLFLTFFAAIFLPPFRCVLADPPAGINGELSRRSILR